MKAIEVLNKVLAGKKISKARIETYKQAFKCWMRFSEDWPEDIGRVNEWINSMPKDWSDETVVTYFDAMLASENYLVRINRNQDGSSRFIKVFGFADKPLKKEKHRRYFKPAEMEAVLKACRGIREALLVTTIFESTCRIGDLVNLKAEDIDVEAGTFTSRKGKTGELTYHCSPVVLEQIKRMAVDNNGISFVGKRNHSIPATVDNLKSEVRAVFKRAGLTGAKLGAHTLRHTGASMIAKSSKSGLVVMQKLQHRDITTSMKYIHDADEIARGVSPLEMLHVRPVEQSAIAEHTDGTEVVVESQDLTDKMFDSVPAGLVIRPRLMSEELELMRSVIVDFTRSYRGDSRIFQCQVLLKRMLRKAGKGATM